MYGPQRLVNTSASVPLDRYIPRRRGSSLDLSYVKLLSSNSVGGESGFLPNESGSPRPTDIRNNSLRTSRLSECNSVLNISQNQGRNNCSQTISDTLLTAMKPKRQLPKDPEYSYDMPGLIDDFYSSPMAWSRQGIIAVALNQEVTTSRIANYRVGNQALDIHVCGLLDVVDDGNLYVTAVVWDPEGRYLALGTKAGFMLIYDHNEQRYLTCLQAKICFHEDDVEALVWIKQEPYTVLYGVHGCGCLRKVVFELDEKLLTIKEVHSDKYRLIGEERLCGLTVSDDERYMAYSGRSGRLFVTRLQEAKQPDLIIKGHVSAVKALAFCPWQSSLLASGGGSRDGTIKGHKVTSGVKVFEIPGVRQVCSLVWSPATKELISGHGEGDIRVHIWSYPDMEPVGFLHTENMGRVIALAISPDGSTLATLTTDDESLSLWQIAKESNDQTPKRSKSRDNNCLRLASCLPGSPLSACIR